MAEEKKETVAIEKLTREINGVERLNLGAFEPKMRKEVVHLLGEMNEAVTSITKSHLRIGEILTKAKELLTARGNRTFVAFLNEIPGMSIATAYRYINAWEVARQYFPEAILSRIIASSLPMIGTSEQPYGKYTEVIQKRGLLPPKNASPEQADRWIAQVQEEYGKVVGKRKAKVPDPTLLAKEAYEAITRRYRKLPKQKQTIKWVRDVFGYVIGDLGISAPMTVEPLDTPTDWKPAEKEEKSKGKKGKKPASKEETASAD